MTNDLSFTADGRRFNYRIAGVCEHDQYVLLHRAETDDFWAMPGGRCRHGEDSASTLRRELSEELGVVIEELRLLWFVENFFEHLGEECHELAFYYRYALPTNSPFLAKEQEHPGHESDQLRLIFRWFPVADLERVELYPSFLRRALAELPDSPQHVVHRDPKKMPDRMTH